MVWSDRWDPVRELRRFQRNVDEVFSGVSGAIHQFPPVNVWTSENDAILTAELPGVDPKDLDISVQGETITLRGQRQTEKLNEHDVYHRRERILGQFSRSLTLPFRVDGDKVNATMENGVLTITLPRAEADKPKKVTIKAS